MVGKKLIFGISALLMVTGYIQSQQVAPISAEEQAALEGTPTGQQTLLQLYDYYHNWITPKQQQITTLEANRKALQDQLDVVLATSPVDLTQQEDLNRQIRDANAQINALQSQINTWRLKYKKERSADKVTAQPPSA